MTRNKKDQRRFADGLKTGRGRFKERAVEGGERKKLVQRGGDDQFRAIFNSVNEAIFIHELPSGAILDVNKRMCEMYGYTREEALLLDVGKLSSGVPPYTQQDAMRRVAMAAKGEPQLLEWHARKKSGELFWVEVNLRRATIANVERLLVVVRDIARRKKSEESSRLNEGRFTKMFEEAPIGIVLLNPKRNVSASNRMFREFVGYSEEEIVAGGLRLFTYPEDMQAAIKLSDRLRTGELPYFIMEHRYVRKDSKVVWAELSAVAIRDEKGKLLHTIAWVKDIDERKRAEDSLRKSEAHYRTLVETSPDIIASFDRECRFLFVNSAVSQESPINPDAFIGKRMRDVGFSDEQAAFRETKIKEVFETKIPFESEFEFSGHTGTHVFDWRVYPVLDLGSSVLSVYSISRNITERKRAEEELREQLSFQEFLSELSNEFVHSSGRESDHLINSGLEKAGSHFGAESAYILLVSEDEKTYSLSYEWHAEGYPGMQGYGSIQRGYLPWTEGIIFAGDIVKINTLEDIPSDFPAEQAVRRDAGVKSVLIAPMHGRRGSVRGGIGVRTFSKNIKWSLEHEQRLRLLGDLIANVLERNRAEESLQTSLDQLHLLTARLETVSEDERKSISHEVHDELGQILTAIRLDLATINESGTTDENLFRSKLKSVIDLTDKAIEAVQQIAARLRPEILDYLGLFPAMEWQVDEFQKHSNVACELHIPEKEPEVDSERSTVLFRILQEALTNVARHAKARKVEITFSESENDFELSVADDGVGITEDQISNPTSFGLLGIKERLHPFKGTCTIKRRSEGGTEINVRLPKHL